MGLGLTVPWSKQKRVSLQTWMSMGLGLAVARFKLGSFVIEAWHIRGPSLDVRTVTLGSLLVEAWQVAASRLWHDAPHGGHDSPVAATCPRGLSRAPALGVRGAAARGASLRLVCTRRGDRHVERGRLVLVDTDEIKHGADALRAARALRDMGLRNDALSRLGMPTMPSSSVRSPRLSPSSTASSSCCGAGAGLQARKR
jgi:hypothetical protein